MYVASAVLFWALSLCIHVLYVYIYCLRCLTGFTRSWQVNEMAWSWPFISPNLLLQHIFVQQEVRNHFIFPPERYIWLNCVHWSSIYCSSKNSKLPLLNFPQIKVLMYLLLTDIQSPYFYRKNLVWKSGLEKDALIWDVCVLVRNVRYLICPVFSTCSSIIDIEMKYTQHIRTEHK